MPTPFNLHPSLKAVLPRPGGGRQCQRYVPLRVKRFLLFQKIKKGSFIFIFSLIFQVPGLRGQPLLSDTRDTTRLAMSLAALDDSLAAGKKREVVQTMLSIGHRVSTCKGCESALLYLRSYMLSDQDEYDSARVYGNQALALAQRARVPLLKPRILLNLSRIHRREGDLVQATHFCNEANKELAAHGTVDMVAKLNLERAIIYNTIDDFTQSLKFLYENLKLTEQLDNARLYAEVYNLIGLNLRAKGDSRASLEQYKKSLKILGTISPYYREKVIFNLGEAYGDLNRLDLADSCLKISLRLCDSLHLRKALAGTYAALGDLETKRKNLANALRYHQMSVSLFRDFEMTYEGVRAIISLGDDYYSLRQFSRAVETYQEAYDFSARGHLFLESVKSLKALAHTYASQGKMREAYQAEQQRSSLYEKQLESERSRQQSLFEARYELKKKEEVNQLLNANNELILKEVEAQKREKWFYFVVIILLAVITLVTLYGFWLKQKLTRQLTMQNKLIEEQKEELAKSLDFVRKSQSQLVFSEKMASLGSLTAGVAHEVNNPLNFISGGVEVLSDSFRYLLQMVRNPQLVNEKKLNELEQDAEELFTSVNNGVHRVSKIIGSLNSFSSPQVNEFANIDIVTSLEMSLTLLNRKINDHGIQLTKLYGHGNRLVHGNAALLSQVFINIIDNAIHALESITGQREITIATRDHLAAVEITITDNGPGIPEEIQHRITEPFFTTKAVGKGTGLGLYISYGIIKKHNGHFAVASTPGNGTSFTITLKAATADEP